MRGLDKGYDHWKTTEPPEFCEFPPDADGEESEMDRVCRRLREARTMLADADKLIVACCPVPSENSPYATIFHAAEKRQRERR